ncbi:MAG: hydantoinase B/oxoprolinase family protein [Candidatus Tectomicrobia bacterium]|uniref:Hydantoinase B/oxoprolinase family protein n=1 Tax=Tectimicrobiota bacterium TaxID=2528274 RepID=A0A932GPA4_UNCTE|nr:hydantoinase B/oxoprolinase family protein [Candidatus Tectomicrobia bacterium]
MNAIDLEVIYQSTLQIARELTLNMLRTGYSTIIKESQDFTFAIFDARGRMVAQGIPQPLHIGPLAAQIQEIRRVYRGKIEPGDAFIVNHPYRACQNHATDITIISPMFVGERLTGFIGNIAHKPDLGGKVPGTNSGDATDLFQEGLLIPPLKLLRRGELNSDLYEMICANTRTPEVTWGDINAQANTNVYGLERFTELFGKYGVDKVLSCWERWMEICETELRKEIAKVPAGLYGPESDYLDDDGVDLDRPYRITASLEVKGDRLHFILDSDPQARGPINLRPCVSRNFIECCVKMVFAPQLPVNDGLSRPVRISYPPEGSLLNPRYPAPVNMYVRPSQITTSVIVRVLAHALPGRVPAPGSAAGGSLSTAGYHPRWGRWYSQYEIFSGGSGARPHGDGVSAMDELVVNVMNTPVEAVESEFPVRVESYELVPDSAGPGTFRGGLGTRRQWRILAEESVINLRTDRFKFSSPGVFGAKPARPSQACLNPGTPQERPLTSKVANLRLKKGDLLSWELAGGGGWGDPLQRDPERVRQDVLCGYVSLEVARTDYGVVLNPEDLSIDREATARLRAEGARS